MPAALIGMIPAEPLGRTLDEARGQEADRDRHGRYRGRTLAHDVFGLVEDVGEAALTDGIGELVEPFGGAVDERADVRPILERAGRFA